MTVDLRDRNILVTGGSMGIGRAVAEACLRAGASVTICARSDAPLRSALEELKAQYAPRVNAVRADVTSEEQVHDAIAQAEHEFGPLSGVAHAAGIYGSIGPVDVADPAVWMETVRVNLFGSYIVARQACMALKKHGGGRLVFLAGGGAASPFPNYTAYACSKVAVVRFVETLADEMAEDHIEANCIAPGFVVTRLHQQTLEAGALAGKDFLERTKAALQGGENVPATVAGECAAFLLSESARGITGKFVAAPYDRYREWPERAELQGSDIFTLRRIVPRDRGLDWQ